MGEELQAAMKSTTAAQAKIVLSSDDQSALTLSEADPNLSSMVKYTQEGGGSFSIKLHGLRRKTSKEGAKEITIASMLIEGNERIIPQVKELFDAAEN